MDNNTNHFIFTYGTPLMDVQPLHKDLEALADTYSAKTLLPGKYSLPVDVYGQIEGTLKII